MTKYLLILIAIALAYFSTGYIGLQMPAVGTTITLIWLPTGIAVASLFRFGYRFWPAISIASVCVNLTTGDAWLTCFGIAVGNTLAPLLTAGLLHKLKFNRRFERQYDIAVLAIAAHLCMLISASTGVVVLSLSATLTKDLLKAWLCWWAGDSMGVIAAAPLLLVASRSEFEAIQKRALEFASWLTLAILATGCIFVLNDNVGEPAWALAFMPLPLIAWATLRFGASGTSLAIIVISSGAAYGTSLQSGPFYRVETTQQVLLLWVYMVTIAILGWLIAALHFEQLKAVNIQKILEDGLRDASLGVLLTDSNRLITYVNEGFSRLTGYDPKELLGKNCDVLQGEKTDPKTINQLRDKLNENRHFEGEIINYRKDGSTFWNRLLISPIFDDAGKRVGFFGFQRDITATKETEFALQRSEARLRTILELEPECVTIISTDGRILEMNRAGLDLIQADSAEQVCGTVLESLITMEFRQDFHKMHLQILAGQSGVCIFPIVGSKGAKRWLESHAVPYRDADETIIGQLAVIRDITARKQAEVELKASEIRYRSLFKNNPHPMWVYDLESLKFLAVNNAAIEHYGYSHDEFLAMTIQDIRPLEDILALKANIAGVTSGLDRAGIWRHLTKAGNLIQVEINSHVTEFDGRRCELVLAYDVTERIQALVAGLSPSCLASSG